MAQGSVIHHGSPFPPERHDYPCPVCSTARGEKCQHIRRKGDGQGTAYCSGWEPEEADDWAVTAPHKLDLERFPRSV